MEAIYAWTETDLAGGEGVIGALIPTLGAIGNLQSRRRDMAESMMSIAEGHKRSTGHKVRLVRFVRDETLETL
jgi:hypothetical protein